jgi:site-specific recombinase XerD
MTGKDVLALVQHLLSLSANHYTQTSTTSGVRTFMRFLQWSGLNNQDLARFVPRTPCWRLTHLPSRLAWEDVRRVIDAIDVTTPSGVRDRALLLALATTGLRNKELRSLELQDIHWRSGEVLLHRDRVVPLLQEAGAALSEYVLHARPRIRSRRSQALTPGASDTRAPWRRRSAHQADQVPQGSSGSGPCDDAGSPAPIRITSRCGPMRHSQHRRFRGFSSAPAAIGCLRLG